METNTSSKRSKFPLLILIVLVVLLIAASVLCAMFLIRRSHYNNGLRYLEAGDYPQAQQEFLAAGNYSDAADMALTAECMEHYRLGEEAFGAGDYTRAVQEFTAAGSYSDAPERVAESRKGEYYVLGEEALTKGDYSAAVDDYTQADDFSDAAQKKMYCNALLLMEQKDYDSAYTAFETLNGFLDSTNYMNQCRHYQGLAAMEREDYATAYKLLSDTGLPESRAPLAEAGLLYGQQLLAARSFSEAEKCFQTCKDYGGSKSAEDYIKLCQAEQLLSQGNLVEGIEAFDALSPDFQPEEFDLAARLGELKAYRPLLVYEGNWGSSSYNIRETYTEGGWVYTRYYEAGKLTDQYLKVHLVLNEDGTVDVQCSTMFYYISFLGGTKALNFTIPGIRTMPYSYKIDDYTTFRCSGTKLTIYYQRGSSISDVAFTVGT